MTPIADCDLNSLPPEVPAVPVGADDLQPDRCVVLSGSDPQGPRYFLGPSALEASAVARSADIRGEW